MTCFLKNLEKNFLKTVGRPVLEKNKKKDSQTKLKLLIIYIIKS